MEAWEKRGPEPMAKSKPATHLALEMKVSRAAANCKCRYANTASIGAPWWENQEFSWCQNTQRQHDTRGDFPHTISLSVRLFWSLDLIDRASSVYVIHVDHNYVGCYTDVKGDRDMLLVPKVRRQRNAC